MQGCASAQRHACVLVRDPVGTLIVIGIGHSFVHATTAIFFSSDVFLDTVGKCVSSPSHAHLFLNQITTVLPRTRARAACRVRVGPIDVCYRHRVASCLINLSTYPIVLPIPYRVVTRRNPGRNRNRLGLGRCQGRPYQINTSRNPSAVDL